MKTLAYAFALSTFALAGCGGGGTTGVTPPADAGTVVADVGTTPPADTGVTPAETYPAGPYGSSVGRRFRPFTLTACNREGDEATWRFDGPEFFSNQMTVISIAAAWCVPCQREAAQIEEQIIQRYAGQNVRFVQLLVQNVDGSAITAPTCRSWVTRYGITFPELMDPAFVTQPFVPMTAFPGNLIVDRCGTIRWRQYGAETGLTSIRTAIDEVLADPRYPNCPSSE
jgi:thiol-disulfide isomerase/thioredoxin